MEFVNSTMCTKCLYHILTLIAVLQTQFTPSYGMPSLLNAIQHRESTTTKPRTTTQSLDQKLENVLGRLDHANRFQKLRHKQISYEDALLQAMLASNTVSLERATPKVRHSSRTTFNLNQYTSDESSEQDNRSKYTNLMQSGSSHRPRNDATSGSRTFKFWRLGFNPSNRAFRKSSRI